MSFNIFEHDDAVFPVLPTFAIKEEEVLESAAGGVFESSPKERKSLAKKLLKFADDGGTIQATEMLQVTKDPKMHTTMNVIDAAKKLGVISELEALTGEVYESSESAIFEASDSTASMAMSAVLAWIDGGDYSYSSFDEYVAGIADLDGNEEFSDDELALYNDLFNAAADAFLSLGADAGDVDSFLNGEDDGAGAKIGEIVSATVDQESATNEEMLDGFAGGDAVMESGVMESSFKKMKVVRGGKVKIVKKRIGKVILSAAQKASLKKARRKAFSSVARIHRAKSMKIRKQRGM